MCIRDSGLCDSIHITHFGMTMKLHSLLRAGIHPGSGKIGNLLNSRNGTDGPVSYTHLSQRSYSHYETGSRNIPIEMLIRLANYYEISLDYLVGRTDNKKMAK